MASFPNQRDQDTQMRERPDSPDEPEPANPPFDPVEQAEMISALRRRDNEMQNTQFMKAILAKQPIPTHATTDQYVAGARTKSKDIIALCNRLIKKQADLGGPGIDRKVDEHLRTSSLVRAFFFFQTHSINDLPNEILANIFRFVCWATNNPDTGIQFRLHLTSVCRKWRHAALADSTLWTAIWFKDRPPHHLMMEWLDRAGTAPLDVRINDGNWSNQPEGPLFTGEQMTFLMERLMTKVSQIRIFVAVVENWPPALVVLDKLRQAGQSGAAINMERFELHRVGRPYVWIGSGYQPEGHREPIPLFGGVPSPRLTHMTTNGVALDWNKSRLESLTTLDLRRIPLDVSPGLERFRDALAACPLLEKLTLDGAGPQPPPDPNPEEEELPPIVLKNLKILVIGDFSLQYAVFIVSVFTAPNVIDLTLMNMAGEDYSPLFVAMTGAFMNVRLLTAYSIDVMQTPESRRILVGWLESLPRLQYLRIAQAGTTFFSAFIDDPDDAFTDPRVRMPKPEEMKNRKVLCPQLDILEYQNMDPKQIIAWGGARKTLGVPLKKIYVTKDYAHYIQSAFSQLRSICPIMVAPANTNTPDEDRILAAIAREEASSSTKIMT